MIMTVIRVIGIMTMKVATVSVASMIKDNDDVNNHHHNINDIDKYNYENIIEREIQTKQ